MSENAAIQLADRETKFVPFMAKDPITLTVRMVRDYLSKPTRSGVKPTDSDVVRFIMLCKSRALNPFEGDAYIVGYDGKNGPEFNLITAHQAFLKRAEVSPAFDGMESGVIVERDGEVVDRQGDFTFDDERLLGAWATVYRRDRSRPTHRRLKLSAFVKPYGVWTSNPAGMIVKCAEADAMRSAFPNSLAGMYFEGEIVPTFAVDGQARTAEPTVVSRTEHLAKRLTQQAAPVVVATQMLAPQPTEPTKRGPGRPRKVKPPEPQAPPAPPPAAEEEPVPDYEAENQEAEEMPFEPDVPPEEPEAQPDATAEPVILEQLDPVDRDFMVAEIIKAADPKLLPMDRRRELMTRYNLNGMATGFVSRLSDKKLQAVYHEMCGAGA